MVRFDVTPNDAKVIRKIANRAVRQARDVCSVEDWAMDLTAVHTNGCRLRLRELLLADDFNFAHDLFGIRRHLDRQSGELDGRFLPRFAAPNTKGRL